MKKWLIGIVLLLGVVIAAKQLMHKDYSSAKKLADTGNYQAFYAGIKKDIGKGDKDAINVLMHYFLKAVQEGDITEAKYYLEQDRSIVNYHYKDGARAIDAALVGDVVRIDMMKFLLNYQPELNYKIPYFNNISLLQMIALNHHINNGDELINLLIDHGANVNFHSDDGEASNSPLLLSYSADNSEIFKSLLGRGALIKDPTIFDDKHDLLALIAGSYVLELQKYLPDIKAIYAAPLTPELKAIIQSPGYRVVYNKNMDYLKVILETVKLNEVDERGLSKLAQYYATTNEVDGTKLLVDHGLCRFSSICENAMQKARLNNNTAIVLILKGK